jgi:hypothetical protein
VLTLVILVGYGAYVGYDKLTGNDTPTAETGTGYVASMQTAIAHGKWSIVMGLGYHNLKNQYVLRNQLTTEIDTVRNQQANLEALLPNVLGPRADTVRASIQSMSDLQVAMAQWRDAIFLLKFGDVDDAEAAITSAVTALEQQLNTWNGQEGT